MKKFVFALITLCMMASPVVADTWTFTPTVVTGTPDHYVYYHKAMPDPLPTAADFISSGGFAAITIPASDPQTFTLNYADGVQYGMYVEMFDALGDSVIIMDNLSGNMSPTVFTFTAIPSVVAAHYEDVLPSAGGNLNVTVNVTVGQ